MRSTTFGFLSMRLRPLLTLMSPQRAAWSVVMGGLVLALLLLGCLGCASSNPGRLGAAHPRAASATATPSPSPSPARSSSSSAPTPAPTGSVPDPVTQLPGWQLVWDDEFDGTALDPSKWNIVSDAPGGYQICCLKGMLNAWDPNDVSVVNGNLRLTTEQRSFQGAAYTSGAVTTEGKFTFFYGRLDIRARLPRGDGLWPAFWLLPTSMHSVTTRATYEVDVMEALGQDVFTEYMVRWMGDDHQYCQYSGPDFSAGYHVYSFIWSPTSITWLVDGVTRCQFHQGIPTTPMYLIVNTYLGGPWPVPPDASTVLPQDTDIDYVRAYVPFHPRPPRSLS